MKKIVAGTLAVLALTASVFAAPKKGQVRYLNFKPEVASVYQELAAAYEKETGTVIIEAFRNKGIDPDAVPGVIVYKHGPFAWGTDADNAVHNAVVLEELAFMAFHTEILCPSVGEMQKELLDKHYLRKHGAGAYYGQK